MTAGLARAVQDCPTSPVRTSPGGARGASTPTRRIYRSGPLATHSQYLSIRQLTFFIVPSVMPLLSCPSWINKDGKNFAVKSLCTGGR